MDTDVTGNWSKPTPVVDEKGRAADRLFAQFARMIQTGELAEGSALPPEREIVETYGVSRTVVREAVQALANRGLVDARPRFRPVVLRPSFDAAFKTVDTVVASLLSEPQGVRDLFETRILVEAALVRQAATEATSKDVQDLQDALRANEAAIEDSEKFYLTDKAFHEVFFQVGRNPVLISVHKAYIAWLAPQWSKMPRLPERNRSNYRSHKEICEAVLMHDPDRAEAALRKHMDDAWNQVKQTFVDF
ncbi:FCD domain-containing protein [bacterium]|nr:FCD domain-containing protein [bacterium]